MGTEPVEGLARHLPRRRHCDITNRDIFTRDTDFSDTDFSDTDFSDTNTD
jgi:hypothetical protein